MFFFLNDTATTEIYTLSLHDALPISGRAARMQAAEIAGLRGGAYLPPATEPVAGHGQYEDRKARSSGRDRKSTRLNSSHLVISYAVFCLKKKQNTNIA